MTSPQQPLAQSLPAPLAELFCSIGGVNDRVVGHFWQVASEVQDTDGIDIDGDDDDGAGERA